jgi:ferrochelatase
MRDPGLDRDEHARPHRIGVLLVNLGTPAAPTPVAVARYLREFLSDPRVIELPRLLWWPLLHGVILPLRAPRSARAYRSVWTAEGSPLLVHTRALAAGLQRALDEEHPQRFRVALAMRYGAPSIAAALDELDRAGARRLLVLPLYPQYSATTTASVFDALGVALRRRRWLPDLRFLAQYHDHPEYIAALAERVRSHWRAHGRGRLLLMSFHGIPERYFRAGDPYHCHCQKSARLLAEALDLQARDYRVSFQSRVGREPWLQPYTDQTVVELARAGGGDLDVICPGFAVDCLETLEEIAEQNAHAYAAAGGGRLRYVPALNDGPEHIALLRTLVSEQVQGWPEHAPGYDPVAVAAERARQAARMTAAMG